MKAFLIVSLLLAVVAAQLYNTNTTRTVLDEKVKYKLQSLKCTLSQIERCFKLISNAYGGSNSGTTSPLAECRAGAAPQILGPAACCFSCFVKPPKVDDVPRGDYICTEEERKLITACASNEKPTIGKNGCPTCYLPPVLCTSLKLTACSLMKRNASFPECAPGSSPTFDRTTCCVDCKPAPPKCTEKLLFICKNNTYPNLKDCPVNTIAKWDDSVCCYNCKTVPKVDEKPVDNNTPCSKADYIKCASVRPACTGEQLATSRRDSCCKDCTEQETICSKADVLECYLNSPVCDDDERPTPVSGACCKHCRPKPRRPSKCVKSCLNDEICARDNINDAFVCRKKKMIALKMKLRCKSDITKEKLRELFRNLIRRYCSRPQNEERCKKFKARMEFCDVKVDYKCGRTTLGYGPVVVISWECPDRNTTVKRNVDELEQALNDAIADSNEGDAEYDAVIESSTTVPPTQATGTNPTTQAPTGTKNPTTQTPTKVTDSSATKVTSVLFAVVALVVVFLF